MQTEFRDDLGRLWQIEITEGKLAEIKRRLKVNLLSGEDVEYVGTDPETHINVLWLLCRKQAEPRNITEQDFAEALLGDPIEAATAALIDSLKLFGKRVS